MTYRQEQENTRSFRITSSEKTEEESITQLIRVKGIGRWIAEMFLIFYFRRLDVLPVAVLRS
jgi:3-methyladenine DNA glycosylase/8-oxoguanine DNA glycosylase